MKTGKEFEETVYGYWAKRFDCSRQHFLHPGTLVIREEEMQNSRKIYLYHIDRMSLVRVSPSILPEGYGRELGSLTAEMLEKSVQATLKNTLLDWFLDGMDFHCVPAPAQLAARQLDADKDRDVLSRLYEVCTEAELDEAAIDLNEPDAVICGLLDGAQLVAYAGFRYWDEVIADMGVLIHPAYRSRGLGKAVVSALCEWCLQNDVVPMYRVMSYHAHSRRIPEALGFRHMVTVETLEV